MMFGKLFAAFHKIVSTLKLSFTSALQNIKTWMHIRRLANRFPGPPTLPIFGNLLMSGYPMVVDRFVADLVSVILKYQTGQIWLGIIRYVFINDPEDVQCFLQNTKNQTKPTFTSRYVGDAMGHGLIASNGVKWRRHHRIILPAFHPDSISTYVSIVNKHSDIFVNIIRKDCNNQPFDVKKPLLHLTFDIVLDGILKVPSQQQTHTNHAVFEAIEEGTQCLRERLKRPWLSISWIFFNISEYGRRLNFLKKTVDDLCVKAIEHRKDLMRQQATLDVSSGEKKSKRKGDIGFIDALLDQTDRGNHMSMQDIIEEIKSTILAGFDTVAATVQLALYSLAWHSDVQEKAVAELRSIFDENGPAEITSETLEQMVYLDMIVKETLRLYPPVWGVLREANVDVPLQSSDLVVPAGCTVMIMPKALHSDPNVYPNPEIFDPERFSSENSASRHPYSFLPFAGGVRACIAKKFAFLEAKTIIAKIIWHYEVRPDPTYKPSFRWAIATLPKNGLWIKMVKRR